MVNLFGLLFLKINLVWYFKVLVSEWIEGEQLAKSSPEVINRLIPVGVECFLIQVYNNLSFFVWVAFEGINK